MVIIFCEKYKQEIVTAIEFDKNFKNGENAMTLMRILNIGTSINGHDNNDY